MIFCRHCRFACGNRPPIGNEFSVIARAQKVESFVLLPFPVNKGNLNFRLIDKLPDVRQRTSIITQNVFKKPQRGLIAASRGARNPQVLHVHSGFCAPGSLH